MHKPTAEQRVGTTLRGKWTLERVIGVGGMATVYEALHRIGRRDAIKVLHRELADEPTVRDRFQQEAHAANRFTHPGAVEIRDMDVSDEGEPFLVMELLRGESLTERTRRLGVEPDELLRHVAALLDVLAAAHAEGIVHRDIKPDNLFITEEGALKVLDFGVARIGADAQRIKLTRDGMAVGTAAYMSPEQIKGDAIDGRSDLYSIGAVMFRMLAKRHVHVCENEIDLLFEKCVTPAPSLREVAPQVPPYVAAVVDRALELHPNDRYPDAKTMQADVEQARRGEEPTFASTPPSRRIAPTAASSPKAWTPGSDRPPADEHSAVDLSGQVLDGRYTLLRRLARGGMGAVYEAHDHHGRPVAVKVIDSEWLSRGRDARRRFEREARATARIDSDNVVRVLDAGTEEDGGHPFLVMELVEGSDLERVLADRGPLEPSAAVRVFIQACHGVAAAHAHGIVHRDIKPANLLLSGDDALTVKVCDFGIAKLVSDDAPSSLTKTGGVLGTLLYASPEQAKNAKRVDARADVWSLCLSLHEALSGTRPWPRCEAQGELILAICTQDVPSLVEVAPWVDRNLAAVVQRGLCREAQQRWQSVDALIAALTPFAREGTLHRSELRRAAEAPARVARAHGVAPSSEDRRSEANTLAALEGRASSTSMAWRRRATPVLALAFVVGGVIAWRALASREAPATATVTATFAPSAAGTAEAPPTPPLERAPDPPPSAAAAPVRTSPPMSKGRATMPSASAPPSAAIAPPPPIIETPPPPPPRPTAPPASSRNPQFL